MCWMGSTIRMINVIKSKIRFGLNDLEWTRKIQLTWKIYPGYMSTLWGVLSILILGFRKVLQDSIKRHFSAKLVSTFSSKSFFFTIKTNTHQIFTIQNAFESPFQGDSNAFWIVKIRSILTKMVPQKVDSNLIKNCLFVESCTQLATYRVRLNIFLYQIFLCRE